MHWCLSTRNWMHLCACRAHRKVGDARPRALLLVQDLARAHLTADKLCFQQGRRQIHHRKLRPNLQGTDFFGYIYRQGDRVAIVRLTNYVGAPQVWNTVTGDELLTLEGHRNVVYAIAFNNPYGDKIITGSFGTTQHSLFTSATTSSDTTWSVIASCTGRQNMQNMERKHRRKHTYVSRPQHRDCVLAIRPIGYAHRDRLNGQHGENMGRSDRNLRAHAAGTHCRDCQFRF